MSKRKLKQKRIRVLKEEIAMTTNPNKLGQLYALLHKEEDFHFEIKED